MNPNLSNDHRMYRHRMSGPIWYEHLVILTLFLENCCAICHKAVMEETGPSHYFLIFNFS